MRRNLFHCSNSQQGATDKVTLLFGITIFFKFHSLEHLFMHLRTVHKFEQLHAFEKFTNILKIRFE